MDGPILVLNAGSSSLKFALFDATPEDPKALVRGRVEGLHDQPAFRAQNAAGDIVDRKQWPEGERVDQRAALAHVLDWLDTHYGSLSIGAAAHRVVHGGIDYAAPVRVDDRVLADLQQLEPLAPLHQPHNVAIIRLLRESRPALPQIACFDTAFHRTQPEVAQRIALPEEYVQRGIRRYGFHGLSYEYIAAVLPQVAPRAASGRTVVLHLGNGASMCAMRNGQSVATTMGFTPLDGLVMGTRCGSIDPGVPLYLMQQGMDADAVQHLLYHYSGLLAVSGFASDMRALRESNDPRAQAAIDLFIYRAGRELGSLAAALQGLDAIVFTAGIGEHDQTVRARICRDAAWLGVEVDDALNEAGGPLISKASSRVSAWVIPTDEEVMMARHARRLLAGGTD